ncbi:Imm1 family immunity protein [Kitasatospora sp. NPDC056181]|uniref:Imm1 family immunity protein n=1 Tax=Kitasatospora sp. NPDC056181 TaxID=3345737 RepID=UPI0035E32F84
MNIGARIEARYRPEHGRKPVLISTVEELDSLVDELLTGPPDSNAAILHSMDRERLPTGVPDHYLWVGVDRDVNLGFVTFVDEGGNFTSLGSPETRTAPVYCIAGQSTECTDHSEIPIEFVRQAVKEFLTSGGKRPACIEWQNEFPS